MRTQFPSLVIAPAGGGVSAHSFLVAGKDYWAGNTLIDQKVADVNPNVDGGLGHI